MNTSTGVFTPTSAGWYYFSYSIHLLPSDTSQYVGGWVSGPVQTAWSYASRDAAYGRFNLSGSGALYLNGAQSASVILQASNNNPTIKGTNGLGFGSTPVTHLTIIRIA